ncbi:hypothetical protein GALMADRAFT_1030897 [Galerina marginata CBS 339.88]|uniref:Uncharacterized protein n=1 Tax=Galerina marginata (strain CBS 339.88) TaxID=685588 RepID=A0A067SCZ1_GALM3|nr:hypothetical protein GALMADRAFT_1030897 [Galerina marginata CBS 339.88]
MPNTDMTYSGVSSVFPPSSPPPLSKSLHAFIIGFHYTPITAQWILYRKRARFPGLIARRKDRE